MKKSKKRMKIKKEYMKNIAMGMVMFFIAFFALISMENEEAYERKEKVKKIADNCASEVAYQVQSIFNNTYVLDFMVRENEGESVNFFSIAQDLQKMYSEISFVALAPEGVVKQVYPANQFATIQQWNLLERKDTNNASIRAKNSMNTNIAGPIVLGEDKEEYVIGIHAIYVEKNNKKVFWGYALLGIRFDYLVSKIENSLKDYAYTIQIRNPLGVLTDKIYEKQEENLVKPVVAQMKMPGYNWDLAVSPMKSWVSLEYLVLRIFIISMICIIVVVMVRLVYRDIVRQSEMQAALEEEKERYQIAMESSSDTIFEYDILGDRCIFFGSILNGKKTEGNRMELENFETKILTGEMFHYQDIEKAIQFFSGEKTEPFETRYRVKQEDGQVKYVWLSLKGSVLFEQGEPIKVIGTTRNIQARKEMEWKKLEESHKDNLTGLYTEACGRMLIEQYLTAKAKMEECEFFLIGIDNFQQLNDIYGYMFADTILIEVAEILHSIEKSGDICIRLGGDEFILFQKNSNSLKAERTACEIIKRVNNIYSGENEEVKISCCIGRASTAIFNSYEQMLKYAHLAFSYLKDNAKGKQANYINISDEIEELIDQSDFNEREISEIIDTNPVSEDNIISFAFGILEKTKDLKSAIYVLLSRIGKRYDLMEIRIMEMDIDYLSFTVNYRWNRSKKIEEVHQVTHIKDKKVLKKVYNYFEQDGLINLSVEKIEKYKDVLGGTFKGVEEHSNLLCPMCEEGEYKGAIDFVSRERKREWNSEEKHVFKEITKIISTHISRVNADIASKAKSEFLSRMSHEIRTPMNAIIGMTNIAISSIKNEEKTRDCLNKIDVSTKYLLSLINDILDMSRIETGKMSVCNDKFNLNKMVEELDVLIRPQTEVKGLSFVIEKDYDTPFVIGDELRLSQVLINLMGNALKFTNEGGRVSLIMRQVVKEKDFAAIAFAVEDTGIGISEENKTRIFEAFEQEKADTAHKYGGTGLGLAISNNLVHLMGGNLTVDSEEGKGSRFSFTLTFPIYEKENEEENIVLEPVSLEGKHILVVEDNDLNAEIVQTLLEMDGCLVSLANNGKEAIEVYEKNESYTFDCILMDIRMPVMNGMEATRCIRTSEKEDARTVPIVALSANAFDEDMKKSIDCGMNGHLSKPINVDMLHEVLQKVLQSE